MQPTRLQLCLQQLSSHFVGLAPIRKLCVLKLLLVCERYLVAGTGPTWGQKVSSTYPWLFPVRRWAPLAVIAVVCIDYDDHNGTAAVQQP
jgi:hypothetical protein